MDTRVILLLLFYTTLMDYFSLITKQDASITSDMHFKSLRELNDRVQEEMRKEDLKVISR
jgi:hypothetical protein